MCDRCGKPTKVFSAERYTGEYQHLCGSCLLAVISTISGAEKETGNEAANAY